MNSLKNNSDFSSEIFVRVIKIRTFVKLKNMVVLAQLVRASVCGTEGRGFEPHIPPHYKISKAALQGCFFFNTNPH
jgi:hypothetical protein